MKKGIIFDIDGTLWNATEAVKEGWNKSFKIHGLPLVTAERIDSLMGKTGEQIRNAMFPDNPEAVTYLQEGMTYAKEMMAEGLVKIFPHEEEILKQLSKEYTLCILTNANQAYIELLLKVTGFKEYFTDLISHGYNGKNKTENMKILVERNSFDKAVYIGDTQDDYMFSQAAGLPFVFCEFGHGQAIDPEYSISDYSQLPQVIKTIFNEK